MVLRLLSLRQCKKILCYVIHGILVHCIVDKLSMTWNPTFDALPWDASPLHSRQAQYEAESNFNSLSMGYFDKLSMTWNPTFDALPWDASPLHSRQAQYEAESNFNSSFMGY